jgi:hypothetical protein
MAGHPVWPVGQSRSQPSPPSSRPWAGTHNHRPELLRESYPTARQTTTAAAYGSRIGARYARLSGTTKPIFRFEFQTADTRLRSRGGRRPGFACRCPSKRGSRECWMHAAPAVSCANVHKNTHTSIQGSGGDPTFPAQWLYGLYRALPGESGFVVSVASRKLAPRPGRAFRTSARLDANR